MARRFCFAQNEFPYHITGRTSNRSDFALPLDEVWKIMQDELWLGHYLYNLKVHAFLLMPNHFHLIASTPNSNLSQAMHSFMGNTSREINKRAKKINQNFGARYYRTIIGSYNYYCVAYKYLYRNPVKGGLSDLVESYPFSSIQMILGQQPMTIPIEKDDLLLGNIDQELKWLNTAPTDAQWLEVKRRMCKNIFGKAVKRSNRRALEISKLSF